MEAVGQLTGGLADDFNNLLAGISGSLEIMQSRGRQGRVNDIERYMTAAQGAVKRAAALTHRLLAFSRRQTLETNADRREQTGCGHAGDHPADGRTDDSWACRDCGQRWSIIRSLRTRCSISASTPATRCPTGANHRRDRQQMARCEGGATARYAGRTIPVALRKRYWRWHVARHGRASL
jgi:hypothetical protein